MAVSTVIAAFLLLFLPFLSNRGTAHLSSSDKGHISVIISERGLDFAKDLLIGEAVNDLTPLHLPNIQKSMKIPLIGGVHVLLSNITLTHMVISSSTIQPGPSGIVIVASGGSANLTMEWKYSFGTWLIPISVSDKGTALIQVKGLEVGLTINVKNEGGSLKLNILECGCYMKDILITLKGGASWFYQGLVDAFEDQIRSTVEKAITQKIAEGAFKLDSLLQHLPKEIKVEDAVYLNVTFANDPLVDNSSIEFNINGLFRSISKIKVPEFYNKKFQHPIAYGTQSEMLGISLDEAVFKTAAAALYQAGIMRWIVDKVPDQSLLNTDGWKFIIPRLYFQYPDDDMKLDISFTSPPVIDILSDKIGTTIYSDMVIDVVDNGEVIPVACISVVITASGTLEVMGNNIAGNAQLEDFTLSLKWSKVGNFHMFLIQGVMRVLLNTVFMPYMNIRLRKGFPLPVFQGFALQNASIQFSNSSVVICSDVMYTNSTNIGLSQFSALAMR